MSTTENLIGADFPKYLYGVGLLELLLQNFELAQSTKQRCYSNTFYYYESYRLIITMIVVNRKEDLITVNDPNFLRLVTSIP